MSSKLHFLIFLLLTASLNLNSYSLTPLGYATTKNVTDSAACTLVCDIRPLCGDSDGNTPQFKIKPWERGLIPYVILGNFTLAERETIFEAFKEFNKNTCVRFVERSVDHKDFIEIYRDDNGCYSSTLGHQGGVQKVNLAKGCFARSHTVMHELMHALGFDHEHVRPDRDEWVKIIDENICSCHKCIFEKV